MKKLSSILLFLATIVSCQLLAQTLTTSSHPIIIINTSNQVIPDEVKINASMRIIDHGDSAINNTNDTPNHYNGFIGIETRGNSTQDFQKRSYSIELWDAAGEDTAQSLFGMGKEEDWILHSMVIDKSHLRIPYSFYLAQKMGHYAAKWKYVELVIDGNYRGLYILTEKIKRDDDRVDIAKLDSDDIAGDSITGGYILRIDWLEDDAQGFSSNYNSQGGEKMFFQWHYPKATKIQPEQAAYIKAWMDNFEDALFANDFINSKNERYTDFIDINSFIDFLLINELSKNADGYKLSSYVHKHKSVKKDGKMFAGPIWDFDQTYGVSEVCSCNDPTGWTYLQNQNGCEDLASMPMWWQEMMSDDIFKDSVRNRWDTFRQSFLHKDSVNLWIDTQKEDIYDAINRNFTRWDDMLGEYIWMEPEPVPENYGEEIANLKQWLSTRIDWIDANLPGNSTGLSNTSSKKEVRVFPNPTSNTIKIETVQLQKVQVVNVEGQEVYEGKEKLIDLSTFNNGIYFLRILANDSIYTEVIVKQ